VGARPLAQSDIGLVRRAAAAGSLAHEEPALAGACLDVLRILGGLTTGSLIERTINGVFGVRG
jgi:hypothetical protein